MLPTSRVVIVSCKPCCYLLFTGPFVGFANRSCYGFCWRVLLLTLLPFQVVLWSLVAAPVVDFNWWSWCGCCLHVLFFWFASQVLDLVTFAFRYCCLCTSRSCSLSYLQVLLSILLKGHVADRVCWSCRWCCSLFFQVLLRIVSIFMFRLCLYLYIHTHIHKSIIWYLVSHKLILRVAFSPAPALADAECWNLFHPQYMLRVSFSPGRDRACRHCWIFSVWTPLGKRVLFSKSKPFRQDLKTVLNWRHIVVSVCHVHLRADSAWTRGAPTCF